MQDGHKSKLCEICAAGGADFVKTATGYGSGGATIDDLKLMRKHSPPAVRIKAAGGIRTLDALLEVRGIGVSRSGATRTAEMLEDCKRRLAAATVAQSVLRRFHVEVAQVAPGGSHRHV